MTRPDRKARERVQLDLFLHVMQLDPSSVTPGEAPDFVLALPDGRRIGVELVGVNATEQASTNAIIRSYIVPQVERALSQLGVHTELQLMWKPRFDGFPRKAARVDAFVNEIVAFVAAQVHGLDGRHELVFTEAQMVDVEDAGNPAPLTVPEELDSALSMLVIRAQQPDGPAEVLSFITAPGEDEAPVKDKVVAKEKSLARYRAAVGEGEVWLLVVTGEAFEQNVVASLVVAGPIQTGFDHVYLLDTADQTVTILK